MSERRCGACQRWEQNKEMPHVGECKFQFCKVPAISEELMELFNWYEKSDWTTRAGHGNDCPLWQPKEAAE